MSQEHDDEDLFSLAGLGGSNGSCSRSRRGLSRSSTTPHQGLSNRAWALFSPWGRADIWGLARLGVGLMQIGAVATRTNSDTTLCQCQLGPPARQTKFSASSERSRRHYPFRASPGPWAAAQMSIKLATGAGDTKHLAGTKRRPRRLRREQIESNKWPLIGRSLLKMLIWRSAPSPLVAKLRAPRKFRLKQDVVVVVAVVVVVVVGLLAELVKLVKPVKLVSVGSIVEAARASHLLANGAADGKLVGGEISNRTIMG